MVPEASRSTRDCEPYKKLSRSLAKLEKISRTPLVGNADLQSWIEGSTGLENLRAIRVKIQDKSTEAGDAIETIDGILEEINQISESGAAACQNIDTATLARIFQQSTAVPRARQSLETLKKSLDGLGRALEPFTEPTSWRGSARTTWVFHKASPSFQNGQKLEIAIRQMSLVLGEGGVAVRTDSEAARTISLRQYSRLVPEFSAAMIYSDVEYPKWGTEEKEDGTMVVAPVKDDTANIEGAVMLNLILRKRTPSFVYPAFQLGISSAEDVPGLLAGIGLRFTQPTTWSLMFGGMLTWAKDLNDLKPGDVVTGTAQIESDLTLQRQDPALYVAFQYNF